MTSVLAYLGSILPAYQMPACQTCLPALLAKPDSNVHRAKLSPELYLELPTPLYKDKQALPRHHQLPQSHVVT